MRALIVASSSVDKEQLQEEYARAHLSIACDGGLHHFNEVDLVPTIILGDFDSYKGMIPLGAEVYSNEKDFSDLEAAIDKALEKGMNEICILGATGRRLDHFLVGLYSLFRYDVPVEIKDPHNCILVKKNSFSLKDAGYTYFSLVPLDDLVISIQGAKYNLDNKKVSFGSSLLLSNEFEEQDIQVQFNDSRLIVILSDDNKKTLL